MSAPVELSLVVPVYNERESLPTLVEGMTARSAEGGANAPTAGDARAPRVLAEGVPRRGAAGAGALQGEAPLPPPPHPGGGGGRGGVPSTTPPPPLREDQIRDVEPRV